MGVHRQLRNSAKMGFPPLRAYRIVGVFRFLGTHMNGRGNPITRLSPARRIAAGVAAVFVLVVAIPALSATTDGVVSFVTPLSRSAVRTTTPVAWSYKAGTVVKDTSTVSIVATKGTTYKYIAQNLWIQGGGIWWDTTKWTDGAYALTVFVDGTAIASAVSPVYVDNTAPQVHITNPNHDVLATNLSYAVVQGNQILAARATDDGSGIRSVRWLLDRTEVARGNPVKVDFNWRPGMHTLTALACDMAGNQATETITVLAIPGSDIQNDPTPDPGSLVQVPGTPSPALPPGVGLPVLPTPDLSSPPPVDQPSPPPVDQPSVPPVATPSIPPTPLPTP